MPRLNQSKQLRMSISEHEVQCSLTSDVQLFLVEQGSCKFALACVLSVVGLLGTWRRKKIIDSFTFVLKAWTCQRIEMVWYGIYCILKPIHFPLAYKRPFLQSNCEQSLNKTIHRFSLQNTANTNESLVHKCLPWI